MRVEREILKVLGTLLVLFLASVAVGLTLLIKLPTRESRLALKLMGWRPRFLVFLHTFTKWDRGHLTMYSAIEIDIFRNPDHGATRVDWIVLSNSGGRIIPSFIDRSTRRVLKFAGKPMNGNYVVLWILHPTLLPPSVKIYDQDFQLTRVSSRKYYGRTLKTLVYQSTRLARHPWSLETFSVEYEESSGLEINTVNYGYRKAGGYRETYKLISDNFGL